MNKVISSNGLVVGFLAVALACSALGASSAEAANPAGGGVVSAGSPGVQTTNANNANANNSNNANNANNGNNGQGSPAFVVHAGGNQPRPGAGVVSPHLNAGLFAAMKPSTKPRIMPHLVPNQIFAIGLAEGVEVAPGVTAQLNANEPTGFSIGNDGTPSAQFNPHRAPGAAQDTIALMLLPENATQDYAILFDVSPGMYNVSVDAFTIDEAGRWTDVVLSNGTVRANTLNQVTVNYDHLATRPTGIYVILSSAGGWTFQRATGFRR
jgi:hypothetical protein